MTRSPVLLVGGDGWIGSALSAHLSSAGHQVAASTRRLTGAGPERPFLDLGAPEMGLAALPDADVAVLCAAVARLRDCTADPVGSARINVDGTLAVAGALAKRGAYVLLLSTDKVFDGTQARRRREETHCPIAEYGRQKAAAEAGVLALGPRSAVLRLSKVLAPSEALVRDWTKALGAKRPIRPYRDMYLAPVALDQVCRLVERLICERQPGIFHLSGDEDRPYTALAEGLARGLRADPGLIEPMSADAMVHPVEARPLYSSLDMSLEAERFDLPQPSFEETVGPLAATAPSATPRLSLFPERA